MEHKFNPVELAARENFLAAKTQIINNKLPSLAAVLTRINNTDSLPAAAKAFLSDLSEVTYLLAKNKQD